MIQFHDIFLRTRTGSSLIQQVYESSIFITNSVLFKLLQCNLLFNLYLLRYAFATASPDNIKQWKFPDGNFLQNLTGHNSIINCMAVNSDNVLVTGGMYASTAGTFAPLLSRYTKADIYCTTFRDQICNFANFKMFFLDVVSIVMDFVLLV